MEKLTDILFNGKIIKINRSYYWRLSYFYSNTREYFLKSELFHTDKLAKEDLKIFLKENNLQYAEEN